MSKSKCPKCEDTGRVYKGEETYNVDDLIFCNCKSGSKQKLLQELSHDRELAYFKYAPRDTKRLKTFPNRFRQFRGDLRYLIEKLEKVKPLLQERLIIGSLDCFLSDLREIYRHLDKSVEHFSAQIERRHVVAANFVKAEPGERYNPNKTIAKMTKLVGGQAKLAREFERNPELIPIGIKNKLTPDKIRMRNARLSKKSKK